MITVGEFTELHSILTAVVQEELGHPAPSPEFVHEVLARKDGVIGQPAPDPALRWLALLDLAVNPHLLRRYMKDQKQADENIIRALIRFLVTRRPHAATDRDKVDWLATYLFQAREEKTGQPTGWPRAEVHQILQGVHFSSLSGEALTLLEEITSLLEEIKHCSKFSQLTDARIIERGRTLKIRFGDEFFHPDILTPIVNYNLISGKAFHSLLQQTMRKVREFAGQRTDGGPPDTHELLRSDYRSNANVFYHLSELGRGKDPSKVKAAAPRSTQSVQSETQSESKRVQNELQELGIDVLMEALDLKKRQEEIRLHLKSNPSAIFLQGARGSLTLMEWEASAIRTEYPESEKSFRVEFARVIQHAIAILSRIDEELSSYEEKKDSEYIWKKHYDSLLYLLQEGRGQKEDLMRLSDATQKKGLTERSKQLLQTAERLETALAQVTAIF